MDRIDASRWTRRGAIGGVAAAAATACASPSGEGAESPVERAEFFPIGGIEQFVVIRGGNSRNPALLFVHGGPGNAMSPFLSVFASWEEHFTVINWDQRGAGKTFGRNQSETQSITPEQITKDAIEIAEHARKALGKDKLILCGHSMGALLGWRVAQARPDLFHAFVGTGQLFNYERTLLMQAGQPASRPRQQATPPRLKRWPTHSACRSTIYVVPARYEDGLSQGKMTSPTLRRFNSPLLAKRQHLPKRAHGSTAQRRTTATGSPMLDFMLNYDIAREGMTTRIPVMIAQGHEDRIAPPQLAREFVDALKAPRKRFVEISGGHFACFTIPQNLSQRCSRPAPIYGIRLGPPAKDRRWDANGGFRRVARFGQLPERQLRSHQVTRNIAAVWACWSIPVDQDLPELLRWNRSRTDSGVCPAGPEFSPIG